MKPPLIALTAPELAGGIGRNTVNLANEFDSMGYRVDVVVDTRKGQLIDQLRNNVGVKLLRTSHTVGGLYSLTSYLLKARPRVILTPVVRHTILALRARSLALSSASVFVQVHNTYSKTFSLLKPAKRSTRIKNIEKYYPRCNGIITVSKGVADDFSALSGIPGSSLDTIYNPIVTPDLEASAAEEVDHPWFRHGQPPVILGVGRMVTAKNFPLLMEAFEIVRSKIECRLVILGEGPERKALEARSLSSPYAQDISLPGHRMNPFSFMSRAAVFALTSSWEGFGNVLVEAMAAGTPVVSTDCPHGPREILADGKYGPLVPPGNTAELAGSILHILRNPTPRDLLVKSTGRFRAANVAARFLEVFGLPPNE